MAFLLNRYVVVVSSTFALCVLYYRVNYEECAKRMPERESVVFYGKKILTFGLGVGGIGLLYMMYKRTRPTITDKAFSNAPFRMQPELER